MGNIIMLIEDAQIRQNEGIIEYSYVSDPTNWASITNLPVYIQNDDETSQKTLTFLSNFELTL